MKLDEAITAATDMLTVSRVFGDPIEKDGLTLVPTALVTGGAGGGHGRDPRGQQGEGGGYGLFARPAGAYVITGGQVSWRPAVDANRAITMAGPVLIAYLLRRPRTPRARA